MTDNELVELLEDRLSPDERARVLAELDHCADCRALAKDWAVTSSGLAGTPPGPTATVVPAELGAYRLDEMVGAGAMGLVFRAHDLTLDRAVAVKIVRAPDAAARERALDEGRLLATVRHRNVIAVHAAGVGDGVAYLVMELVEGTSLDRVLANGPVDWRVAAKWFREVASGLAIAHAAGVIHRDIKPANLLLDRDELRVADFGLAAKAGAAPAGTPAYLAPEVGDGTPATAKSDQFSFFVALYEAVAGRRPFAGRDLAELRTAWRGGIDWHGVPPRLRPVIARGLALDPDARWPDMTAVEHELGVTTAARRWPLVVGAVGGVAALALGIGLATRSASTCDVPTPKWAKRVSDPELQRVVAGYETQWSAAYAEACARPAQRRCLDAAHARVEAIFASLQSDASGRAAAVRAFASLASPRHCIVAPAPSDPGFVHRPAALDALGRYRDAWQTLPPAERDGPELALLRGQIANHLQDLAAAETALRRAAELASRDDVPTVLADAQTELALVIGYAQDHHDAGAAYADLAVQTALRIADRRRAAIARGVQGLIASARGDVATAIAKLKESLVDLQGLDLATAEMRLGIVLRDARRHAEARPHFETARSLRANALGANHPLVAAIEVDLGITDAAAGDYASATKRYRAIIERLTATYGPNEPSLASPLSALGTTQLRTGDYAGAEQSLARVLALRRATYGDRHFDVVRARVNLASTYYYEGKLDAAIDEYRAADASARSLLGARHPDVATVKSGLALALQGRGRLDDARVVIDEVIAIYRDIPGHDLALADALQTSGIIAHASNRLTDARTALEDSYAIQRRMLGDDHVDLTSVQTSLGELYLVLGQLADAERMLTTAHALQTKHGVAPQLMAETTFLLAEVAWKQGHRVEARDKARTALKLIGDARPDFREQIVDWQRKH